MLNVLSFCVQGSYVVRQGDVVECELTGWAPLDANPEDIPLDIVYEDKHVIVINKPAHMVCASVQGNHLPLLASRTEIICGSLKRSCLQP